MTRSRAPAAAASCVSRGTVGGKSGGFRVITFFSGADIPVILITVYGKGRKADLTGRERADLASLGKLVVAAFDAGSARRHR